MKRTHLPLNGLRVFDAAARHLSFTRAADELAVTPAAVGQQIRALEDVLGVVLFRRTARGLELTPEGEAGLAPLRDGFLHFEEAVRAMQAQQSSKVLTIAAPADLISKYLIERLADYARSDEDIRYHLINLHEEVNFTEANLDLAIIWASDTGINEGVPLAPGGLVRIGEGRKIGWPDDRANADFLVDDAGAALDAARAGLGMALIPQLLLGKDRDGEVIETDKSYWLVAPTPQWRQKKVRALVEALTR